ncbi:MAG: prephenate dehydrogenase [Abditibacteriota bacterium]|nr:prephenate dehydrogenase [Abditibacteriota bacterium]
MQWISKGNILITGLGLMGGSCAMALSRLGYHVTAIDTRPEAIEYALSRGIIKEGSTRVEPELVSGADAAIFGLYPHVFTEWIEEYGHLFRPGAMLTDVTGVKSAVVYDVQRLLPPEVEFIASHPMAGKEVYGVENSDDRIFHDANFIVTPTDRNTPEAVEWCKDLGRILGFRKISVLSPEKHDEMIAFLSQLTHCIAVSLMTCTDNRHLADYTGNSFRDLTRIARINENMWSELFVMNKKPLLDKMDRFIEEMREFRDALDRNDTEKMREKMRLSTERRAWFDVK